MVTILDDCLLYVQTDLLPFCRYRIYLLRLMSVANFSGVSDMSIIRNNTLMTEGSEFTERIACINFQELGAFEANIRINAKYNRCKYVNIVIIRIGC